MNLRKFSRAIRQNRAHINLMLQEAHAMWHSGAPREDIRERVNGYFYQAWDRPVRPPRPLVWLFRSHRDYVMRAALGPKLCSRGLLAACGKGGPV